MKRKQIKQLFIESMGQDNFESAFGMYQNTLLKDIVPNARLYYWNYIFYSYKGDDKYTRAEFFDVYGYRDLRHETL